MNQWPDEHVVAVFRSAAIAMATGQAGTELFAGELGRFDEIDRAQVDRAVSALLDTLLRDAWDRGWQPNDLAEFGRRELEADALPLLVPAIGSQHRAYAVEGLAPQWVDQLAGLGLRAPFESLDLTAWAKQHRQVRYLVIDAVVTLAAFLLTLPVLPRLLPLPGTYRPSPGATSSRRASGSAASTPGASSGVSPVGSAGERKPGHDKALGRIRGLLAKAEATEFPDEADALSAKAQELMAKFSLDQALVDALGNGQGDLADDSAARRIWMESPYTAAKSQLVHVVAMANRCHAVMTERPPFVTVVGSELDLELTEILSTSLLVQANRALLATGQRARRHDESRTQAFRRAFFVAYAQRIGERLQAAADATQAAVEAEQGDLLLPVLAKREQQVTALLTTLFPKTTTRRTRISSGAGWAAGRDAANRATLDTAPALRPA
ncbi:DUF2786 domain-containing protein [Kribbella deserti]|uniref:DUF2786 domain-containing protein n=1 Tax=Kribbella deserti TaxID=1926257 RepID=A0ABV6QUJ7_9ACTN